MQQKTKSGRWNGTRLLRYSWIGICLLLVACHTDMYEQAYYEPDEPSAFFADGRANRPPVPNTIAIGQYLSDPVLFTGRTSEGELATGLPMELSEELIRRGQNRYNIYCAPCHGLTGDGNGIIARRGPMLVTSLHDDRLRTVPEGYLFDVISNGLGRMYGYASRVEPEDRWAIVAYVRALQLSQNANPDDVPPEETQGLER